MPATETVEGQGTTAAGGGDHRVQLRHLRSHREFQRGPHPKARVDWATSITQEESKRHIRRELHRKINLKDLREGSRGRMDTPEGQESMRKLSRLVQGRHRLSPGDGLGLRYDLRQRMAAGGRTDPCEGREPRREEEFPPEIREKRELGRKLRELLQKQGASPRRRREATIILVYACRQCHNLLHQEMVRPHSNGYRACPVCRQSLRDDNLTAVAVRNDGSREPLGSVECHRR